MRKIYFGALVLGALGFLSLFQNCGEYRGYKKDDLSSQNHEQPQLNRLTNSDALNVDMRFEAYGAAGSALYQWSYTLNGAASGCMEKGSNSATTYTINCTQAGPLVVSLRLTQYGATQTLTYSTTLNANSSGGDIPLEVVFEIPAGTNNSPWNTPATKVETFVGQTLKLKNMDSSNHQLHTNNRPCGHGNAIPPGGMVDCVISQTYDRSVNGAIYDHIDGTTAEFYLVAYSGAELYATNCQSCHNSLAMSEYRQATVTQITNAIQNVNAMKIPSLMNLTLRQKQAIAHALKN